MWKGNGVSADLSVDVGRRSLAIDVVALDEFRARLPTRVWIEAVPSQQRVGSLAPDARIRDAGESALVACQEPARRGQVDTDRLAVVTGGRRPVPALLDQLVDDRPVDALERQLAAECDFSARTCPVARLHPGSAKGLVVEHPQLGQPSDGPFDQLRPVARASKPPSNLGHGTGSGLQKPRSRLEDDVGVIDGSPLAAPLLWRTPMPGRHLERLQDHQGEDDEDGT